MLPIIPASEVFSFLLEPIDHGISVLLYRSGKDNDFVPLADLAEKFVAMWAFVDVVEDRMMRSNNLWLGWRASGSLCYRIQHGCVEFDFDHVAAGHATTLGDGVDEGFVEIED